MRCRSRPAPHPEDQDDDVRIAPVAVNRIDDAQRSEEKRDDLLCAVRLRIAFRAVVGRTSEDLGRGIGGWSALPGCTGVEVAAPVDSAAVRPMAL